MRYNKPWSDKSLSTLRKMWQTATAREIAKVIGRSRNAVIGKAYRLELPRKGRSRTVEHKQGVHQIAIKRARSSHKSPQYEHNQSRRSLPVVAKLFPRPQRQNIAAVAIRDRAIPAPNSEPVTIVGLSNHTCRWPLGEVQRRSAGTLYCGAEKASGAQPYCSFHSRMARKAA